MNSIWFGGHPSTLWKIRLDTYGSFEFIHLSHFDVCDLWCKCCSHHSCRIIRILGGQRYKCLRYIKLYSVSLLAFIIQTLHISWKHFALIKFSLKEVSYNPQDILKWYMNCLKGGCSKFLKIEKVLQKLELIYNIIVSVFTDWKCQFAIEIHTIVWELFSLLFLFGTSLLCKFDSHYQRRTFRYVYETFPAFIDDVHQ